MDNKVRSSRDTQYLCAVCTFLIRDGDVCSYGCEWDTRPISERPRYFVRKQIVERTERVLYDELLSVSDSAHAVKSNLEATPEESANL